MNSKPCSPFAHRINGKQLAATLVANLTTDQLRMVIADRDVQLTVRQSAERRLRKLSKPSKPTQ